MPGKLNFKQHWFVRYGSALAAVGASLLLRLALTAWVGPDLPTYITFYPAVMVVALMCGFGPGLLATLATALVVDYSLLRPVGQLGVANAADAVGVALFSGMGVFMSVVAELYRRARQGDSAWETEFFRRDVREALIEPTRQGVLLNVGFAVSLLLLAAAGWQTLRHLAATTEADRWTAHTYATIQESLLLLSTLEDLETGQRGYLITGDEKYLEPYRAGLAQAETNLASLKQLTGDNASQQQRLAKLEPVIRQKLAELQASIELRRMQGFQPAQSIVASDKGKVLMDDIRQRLAGIQAEEQLLLQQRTVQRDAAARQTLQALVAGGILSLLLLVSVFLFLKVENARRRQAEAELRRHERDLKGVVAARTADLSQANESLRESERQFRALADSIPNLAWWANGDGYIVWYNRRWYEYTGTTPQQMEGWGWQSVHDPEILPAVLERWKASIATGQPFDMTFPLRGAGGVFRPFLTRVMPLKDGHGRVQQWFGTNTDVSEQKQAEETHARLAAIVESSDDAILTKGLDGIITSWNAAAERLFGYRPEEIINHSIRKLLPPDRQDEEDHIMVRLQAGERVEHYETVRLAKDGRSLAVSVTVSPLHDSGGRIIGASKIIRDITERKRTEEEMSLLSGAVEAAASGIAVTDRGGRILWVNPAFTKLTGYTAAEAIGQNPRVLKSGQHPPEFYRAIWETVLRGEVWRGELVNKRKDGSLYSEEMTITPMRVGGQEISHFIAIKQDVTQRKQAEAAVHQLNTALQQRVADLQAANEEVQASRRSALSLAEDALEARTEAERINADLQRANDSLATSRQAAINLMDDAVWARRQAEQATAESRSAAEQRRLALEAADLGAWDYQLQTGEVLWDERCREMWGIPQAETINYDGAIADIHPEDRAGVDEAVQQALAGKDGGAYHREFRVIWPDGSAHWISSHGHVYFEGEGEQRRAIRFVGANQEITERKLREEQLQKLNRTLKAHAESDQALVRLQSEGEFLEAVCRIVVEDCGHAMVWVGYAEDDEDRTIRPVAQAGFEEGYLETLNVTWADTERGRGPTGTAIRTGQPCLCRNMLTDPRFAPWRAEAIKRGYASSLVLPLLADGRAFGALTIYSRQPDGFSNDEVTLLTELAGDLSHGISALRLREAKARAEAAQRQSEERYRGLVELSPEALFVNRNDRIVLVNPAALQLFGASSEEQLLGKSPFEVLHRESHAIIRERISKVLAGERVPVLEEKIVRLDGSVVDVEVLEAAVMDQGERAIMVLLRDITERKRAEAALQHINDDLQRSNRDLEQFAYVASHDLQEPLRAVGGYVKLLQVRFPDKLDAKAQGYIAGAFEGATRMERLIEDLLAFSRVGTRGGAFAPANLDVVFDRALRNLETGIAASHATITHDPLPTLPVDATQMMQLFQNLIGNALKFHGESPPCIHVGAQKQEGRWVISVRDNGIGIEPQYYEKIFQIFQRLHTRKDYPGTGIGLAICKKIVERHDGKIWVESRPGQGSTFCFSLPEAASS